MGTAAAMEKAIPLAHARMWRELNAYIDAQAEKVFAPKALNILAAEGTRAATAYEQHGAQAALDAIDPAEWLAYVSKLYLTVVPGAGEIVEPFLVTPMKAASALNDRLVQAAARWLRENGMAEAQVITRNSRRIISDQVRIGVQKGETTEQIAERIRKHYRSVSQSRAETIARTETHAAANYGSMMTAAEQNEPMRKIWLATPDGITRDAHQDMHGQRRMLNEPFSHEGDKLMFPGDTSFGCDPALVINCRCSCGYERVRRPVRPAKPRRVA